MSDEPQRSTFEKVVAEPAIILADALSGSRRVGRKIFSKRPLSRASAYWSSLGPGLTSGASDDDPSGIATYSQAGAQYGFQLLWLSWFTFPLMAVVQEMCARIGLVTGRGLAANIRHNYPRWVLYITTGLLFAANAFNIGADLGAMAQGVRLLLPNLNYALIIITFALISLALQIFTTYARYARYLKYLALVLLAYVGAALLSNIDWSVALQSAVIPTIDFSKEQLILICAILGTTISPYLFFWQTSQEVEEEKLKGVKTEVGWHQTPDQKELKAMKVDVWSGMFLSNAVMFFIIAACAATLFTNGITDIKTAADAAQALRPIAGDAAYLLFAIGIIGTGMLAIPVLAGSASYALSESFGWKHGLYRKLKGAYAFYGVIIIAMVVGIAMNFVGLDPIRALIYSGIANAIIAPIVLIQIVWMSSSKKVMGEYVNTRRVTRIGWFITTLMVLVAGAAIISFFL